MELYPGEKHGPLRDEPWSAARVAAGIAVIVADAVESFDPGFERSGVADARVGPRGAWPTHPLDGDDAYGTSYYRSAGGVFWSVSFLARERVVEEPGGWFSEQLPELIRRNERDRADPPRDVDVARSYLMGDIPLRMLRYVHQRSAELSEQLFARVRQASEGAVGELMWGLAGNLLAALHLHAASGQACWLELYRSQADRLLAAGEEIAGVGFHFRTPLYGHLHDGLGAVHGLAGNAVALLAGLPHLSPWARATLLERVPATFVNTALQSGGRTNWPTSTGSRSPLRLYHCHGAPGIVSSLAALPAATAPELETLMLQAGELIFEAGPLRKGPSLCHGTAGNGFALLKLFERTGDSRWLERARRFAMHALWQVERSRELFGQGRYSLWTGDLGVALFLHECSRASARFPTIDVF